LEIDSNNGGHLNNLNKKETFSIAPSRIDLKEKKSGGKGRGSGIRGGMNLHPIASA